MKKWCVRHETGWCATGRKTKPPEDALQVKTICRHWIILPWGIDWRKPTCPDCL